MNVENFSLPWKGTLSCEDCSTRLNVFRKKKICCFCKNSFCQVCVVRQEGKKFCCRKCQILTARPLDRSKLLNLRSRDLINYLTSRRIPTDGCVEKEDLVNVLIKAVNNSCFHPSSSACIESSSSAKSYPNSPRRHSGTSAQLSQSAETLEDDGIRITGHNLDENVTFSDHTNHCEENNSSSQEGEDHSHISSRFSLKIESSLKLRSSDTDVNADGQSCEASPLKKPLLLSDIKNKSDLDALSVKQLKELLMRNRMDFKGCIERGELIQKANKLWSDYTVSRKGKYIPDIDCEKINNHQSDLINVGSSRSHLLYSSTALQFLSLQSKRQPLFFDLENLSLNELCKICMDAPIECVLLECGHMATCTSCGKQLCECPICRQFVVRCVRTFKA